MRRGFVLTTVVLMVSANAAAAAPSEADPGLITADSPLYPADVALDELLKPPGDQLHERASEALVAAEANNTAAMQRAVGEVNRIANRTNGVESGDGLQRAEQLLQEVREKASDQAHIGLDTAIENVRKAQNPVPDRPVTGRRQS